METTTINLLCQLSGIRRRVIHLKSVWSSFNLCLVIQCLWKVFNTLFVHILLCFKLLLDGWIQFILLSSIYTQASALTNRFVECFVHLLEIKRLKYYISIRIQPLCYATEHTHTHVQTLCSATEHTHTREQACNAIV